MKGLTHRWMLCPEATGTPPLAPSVEPLVARVLAARGMGDQPAISAFLDARLTAMHEPSLLPDCDRAAQRILHAVTTGQPVVVYGDYDVDGICATSILFHALRVIAPGADVRTYVPHRVDEGYGLHAPAMAALAREGARVAVSVDCGVTAFEAAAAARAAGLDLIITDHHTIAPQGVPPDAYAVVHPRRPGSAYPFGELCGAAVAFKLAWRIATLAQGATRVSPPVRETLLDGLALAGMATIADIVPLVGENRIIAKNGLARLKTCGNIGLRALIHAANLAGENIDSEQVGFILGPRINACGRMGHARDAVELMTTAAPDRAAELAAQLTRLNEQRRRTEKKIFDEARRMAEAAGMTRDDRRAIVLAGEGWHTGVVGIVCSRLIGAFHRPTILLNRTADECAGSGRSIDGFSLYDALHACSARLTRFGGHDMAAGLALHPDSLDAFAEEFIRHATERLAPEELTPSLRIDCAATTDEITIQAARQLEAMGPAGRANPAPRLLLRELEIARTPETVGSTGAHLAMFLRQGARELRVMGWGWGEKRDILRAGQRLDAVVEPRLNRWNGRERVEAQLLDLALRA
ncbi:MAG: single-stranded-DNA-specific exonuclease RecJ [Planctomycetota bacterium]|nr:single-stranded-DNA-specific exonuclease RecJ [Planctomycetota bacterium]